jgi:hypothetical protein
MGNSRFVSAWVTRTRPWQLCDSQRFIVAFIDALFLCYSALTVTGLSTVNLSTLTVFQQAILYVLMGVGNVVCTVLYNIALKAL